MAATALKALVVNPVKKHTATVIFVHGLGDSGLGWQSAAEILGKTPNLQHVKWVLPHAPMIPITVNMGMTMPGWFDIFELGFDPKSMDKVEDEKGMMKTIHALNALISTEIDAGTPASRIVLGGFSQGGAMTVATGLTTERKLAGLAVMSGWAPMRNTLKSMLSDHFKQIPIFWGHGTRDPIVRYDVGKASEAWLESVGVKKASAIGEVGLDFHAYEGVEHSTSQHELVDLQNFIAKVLPEST